MPRLRLGVALLVPKPVALEVDVLRRACCDPTIDHIAPHCTLVPPVNVREDRLDDALVVLRAAAAANPPHHGHARARGQLPARQPRALPRGGR